MTPGGEGCDDFCGRSFADGAVSIPDAALRERVLAAASAHFRVEFVQRDGSLFRGEFGEVDAGKLRGAVGVLQEDLSHVLERFHFHVADGQAEQRADFHLIKGSRKPSCFCTMRPCASSTKEVGSAGIPPYCSRMASVANATG